MRAGWCPRCSDCGCIDCRCNWEPDEPEEERCKCGLVLNADYECAVCDTEELKAERRLQYQLERELRFLKQQQRDAA